MPMVILLSSRVPNSAPPAGGAGPNRFLPLMGVGLLPMLIFLVGLF